MQKTIFEWDEDKDRVNRHKHKGVTFNEAKTVFLDEYAIYLPDEKHSANEERFIILGKSRRNNLLIVCHCHRGDKNERIRIISARKANNREAAQYNRRGGAP